MSVQVLSSWDWFLYRRFFFSCEAEENGGEEKNAAGRMGWQRTIRCDKELEWGAKCGKAIHYIEKIFL